MVDLCDWSTGETSEENRSLLDFFDDDDDNDLYFAYLKLRERYIKICNTLRATAEL